MEKRTYQVWRFEDKEDKDPERITASEDPIYTILKAIEICSKGENGNIVEVEIIENGDTLVELERVAPGNVIIRDWMDWLDWNDIVNEGE